MYTCILRLHVKNGKRCAPWFSKFNHPSCPLKVLKICDAKYFSEILPCLLTRGHIFREILSLEMDLRSHKYSWQVSAMVFFHA